jgi:hypothetical protein
MIAIVIHAIKMSGILKDIIKALLPDGTDDVKAKVKVFSAVNKLS